MDAQTEQTDLRFARSWCCRAPLAQVGQHLQCSECGKPNASGFRAHTVTEYDDEGNPIKLSVNEHIEVRRAA